MLTTEEKEILGAMTDMGLLQGDLRKEVGASDDLARERIAELRENVVLYGMELNNMIQSVEKLNANIDAKQRLINLLKG